MMFNMTAAGLARIVNKSLPDCGRLAFFVAPT